jgi:hypothetical protein
VVVGRMGSTTGLRVSERASRPSQFAWATTYSVLMWVRMGAHIGHSRSVQLAWCARICFDDAQCAAAVNKYAHKLTWAVLAVCAVCNVGNDVLHGSAVGRSTDAIHRAAAIRVDEKPELLLDCTLARLNRDGWPHPGLRSSGSGSRQHGSRQGSCEGGRNQGSQIWETVRRATGSNGCISKRCWLAPCWNHARRNSPHRAGQSLRRMQHARAELQK